MTPGGLVEVRVSWSGHPRYLKKKTEEERLKYKGDGRGQRKTKKQPGFKVYQATGRDLLLRPYNK